MLSATEFTDLFERTLIALEDLFTELEDQLETEGLDIENTGQLLTIKAPQWQMIFSKQEAVQQLWLAAKNQGLHFNYDSSQGLWQEEKTGTHLSELLQSLIREQNPADLSIAPLVFTID